MGKEEEETTVKTRQMGSYGGEVMVVGAFPALDPEPESELEPESEWASESAASEILLLWALQDPTSFAPNAFVSQSSLQLSLDACGHTLSILQSPSSLGMPGVTGAVMWDSGVVLGKFLEHAVDSKNLSFEGKKVVELGSGCGLVGCIAALLGGNVVLTDLPDRLRLLKKNVEANLRHGNMRGSATVKELVWGDDPDSVLIEPHPDYGKFLMFLLSPFPFFHNLGFVFSLSLTLFHNTCTRHTFTFMHPAVLGSDVIYSEEAVEDLLETLLQLCGDETTIFLAGELRNDVVLECFLAAALKEFVVGRVDQTQWHPDYCSRRVVLYALVKKTKRRLNGYQLNS